jgi:hypothetical protein
VNQVSIYSPKQSPRLSFITSLIFGDLLGLDVNITTDIGEHQRSEAVKLNYSSDSHINGYQISPSPILFEDDISPMQTQLGSDWKSCPTLLLNQASSFDMLASSFYLVSRYEEYLPFKKDIHSRFTAEVSCLTRLNLLERPLVNEWALALLSELKTLNPSIDPKPRAFEYLSTIDIDQAWKYKNKGLFRNLGGIARDIVNRSWSEIKDRLNVVLRDKVDAFYNFDWQDDLHNNLNTQVKYFIQVGGPGKFDKNTSVEVRYFQSLIKRLDTRYSIGIHPSYRSNSDASLLNKEHHLLENIVGHGIKVSRQHFLMHTMPTTYQRLLEIGIEEDHTLGYSTHLGFRAGLAAPFLFFDLSKNKVTKLKLIPFCSMDITSLHYLNQNPKQAIENIKRQFNHVHSVGGLVVSLWHNESLSEDGRWKGWRVVYEAMVTHAKALTEGH